jgi:hypothetical protein
MRRHEAVLLLARILNSCRPIDVTFISLENPYAKTNGVSEGYELHFKCSIDDKAFKVIKGIITASNLVSRSMMDVSLSIPPKKAQITL